MKTPQNRNISDPCIWMQTGIVALKQCQKRYDCLACSFDRAMRRTADENRRVKKSGDIPPGNQRGQIIFWQDRMRTLPQWRRPCTHFLKKRISFRSCTNDYSCGNCDFDQYFQDQYSVHAVVKPVEAIDVSGFKFPQGYYLHSGHTWVKIEADGTVRLGLDDFSGRLLGPINRILMPLLGKTVRQGKTDVTIQHDRHSAGVMSPVSGVVTDVNPRLMAEPGLVGSSPYADGWILRVHTDRLRQEIKHLMMGKETETFLNGDVDRLYDEIETVLGTPLAADGGLLVADIRQAVPDLSWERMASLFLRT